MHRIEDGVAVEQDEVLVGSPSAHIEAARSFAHGLDAGERLHHFHHIGLAQGKGYVAKLGGTELFHSHLGVVDLLEEALYGHLVEDANRLKIRKDIGFGIGFFGLVFGLVVALIGKVCPNAYRFVPEDGIGSKEGLRGVKRG